MSNIYTNETLDFKTLNQKIDTKANNNIANSITNGLMSSVDKVKLDRIEEGANKYVHPDDANTKHVTTTQIATWDSKVSQESLNEVQTKAQEALNKANEAFQYADNGKKSIVSVIGSPSLHTDTFDKVTNDIKDSKNSIIDTVYDPAEKDYNTSLYLLRTKIINLRNSLKNLLGANDTYLDGLINADGINNGLNGIKTLIAKNITSKGVNASHTDTLRVLADKVNNIKMAQGNAVAADVRSGKTFTNSSGNLITGTLKIGKGYASGTGVQYSFDEKTVTVRGLSFRPRKVIVVAQQTSGGMPEKSVIYDAKLCTTEVHDFVGSSFVQWRRDFTIYNDGFEMPYRGSNGGAKYYDWEAYE